MANHHIREAATGSADGTDWTNAYTDLPSTLTRGDTYYIADGAYGAYTFDDAVSGTIVITIKKAVETEHGSGTGWSSAYGDGQAIFTPQVKFTTGYYTFDGVSRTALDAGHGFKVDNLSGSKTKPVQLLGSTTDNVIIRYLEIQGTRAGSGGINDRSINITGPGPPGNFFNDLKLQYCHFYDSGADNIHTSRMLGFLMEHCLISKNDSEASVHSELWADAGSSNVTIRWNVFRQMEGTGGIIELSRGGDPLDIDNWDIYGNVFYTDQNEGISNGAISGINSQKCNNWKIYNNTFWNLKDPQTIRSGFGFGGSGSGSTIEAKNNLFQECRKVNHNISSGSTLTLDSNVYTDITDTNDKSSETNVQIRDSFEWFTDKDNGDFTLTEATDVGIDTSSDLPGNNSDANGNTRGADGVWDRGAFEFSGSSTTNISVGVKELIFTVFNTVVTALATQSVSHHIRSSTAGIMMKNLRKKGRRKQ